LLNIPSGGYFLVNFARIPWFRHPLAAESLCSHIRRMLEPSGEPIERQGLSEELRRRGLFEHFRTMCGSAGFAGRDSARQQNPRTLRVAPLKGAK
jgi:hypothetical protein